MPSSPGVWAALCQLAISGFFSPVTFVPGDWFSPCNLHSVAPLTGDLGTDGSFSWIQFVSSPAVLVLWDEVYGMVCHPASGVCVLTPTLTMQPLDSQGGQCCPSPHMQLCVWCNCHFPVPKQPSYFLQWLTLRVSQAGKERLPAGCKAWPGICLLNFSCFFPPQTDQESPSPQGWRCTWCWKVSKGEAKVAAMCEDGRRRRCGKCMGMGGL